MTGFDRYFDDCMEQPWFRKMYDKMRAEIDERDRVTRLNNGACPDCGYLDEHRGPDEQLHLLGCARVANN